MVCFGWNLEVTIYVSLIRQVSEWKRTESQMDHGSSPPNFRGAKILDQNNWGGGGDLGKKLNLGRS